MASKIAVVNSFECGIDTSRMGNRRCETPLWALRRSRYGSRPSFSSVRSMNRVTPAADQRIDLLLRRTRLLRARVFAGKKLVFLRPNSSARKVYSSRPRRQNDELSSVSREEAVGQHRNFFPHNQFIQPFLRDAGFAIESAGHLAANRCGRVGVIAEVCCFQDRGFEVICLSETP